MPDLFATIVPATITAGTGLSFSGATLNSVWTASGSNIFNNNAGNVGIGTTTPQSTLSVGGSASIGADYGAAAPTNGGGPAT